jgi:hypothetical protein
MAPRFTNFEPRLTVVRIERPDRTGVDLNTAEFVVTFGGAKDNVGAVIIAEPKGVAALTELLDKLSISAPDIDTATRMLAALPSHTIHDVTLTREVLRRLGIWLRQPRAAFTDHPG